MSATETRERPILFNDEMVRAILDGRKTQTRRPVKPQPPSDANHAGQMIAPSDSKTNGMWFWMRGQLEDCDADMFSCPFGSPGDRLWVREAFAIVPESAYRCSTGIEQTINPVAPYSAAVYRVGFDRSRSFPWKPSIHMPRWASRLTLEVKAVRVERLQSISEDDAEAEGVPRNWIPECEGWSAEAHGFLDFEGNEATKQGREILEYGHFTAREAFPSHWNAIYSVKGLGWDQNPWVWVVEFERVKS